MSFDEKLTELTDRIGDRKGWGLGKRMHFHLLIISEWPKIDLASSDEEKEGIIDEIIQEVDKESN